MGTRSAGISHWNTNFAGGIAVQAAYVLNNGVDLYNSNYPNALSGALPQFAPFSQITPGLGELEMITNNAHSTYNGLQLQARKISPTHGLQFQANYTWAKNLTDADAVWSSGGSNGGISPEQSRMPVVRAGALQL